MANANRSSYQPVPTGGLFGGLLGRASVATPAYRGERPVTQPKPQGLCGLLTALFSSTPAYKPAPTETPSAPSQGDPSQKDPSDPTDPVPGPVPGCDGAPLTIVIARD